VFDREKLRQWESRMSKWLILLLLGCTAARADDRWLRLKSAHFEVFTNSSAGSGRDVLRRFEQIRHVFESRTGRGSLTPLPVRVFVFRHESDFQPYQVNRNAAGYYQAGYERDYIAMQATGADTFRVVYHEYTHLLLRHAGYRVPVWFNEGTAEMFSTAEVGSNEVRVGDLIPAHVLTLRDDPMLDIPTLTSVDQDSPHYNEKGKSGIFYAQSWALIHMLNFAPEYRPGLPNFLAMILNGEDAVRAFQQAFGKSAAVVLQDLRNYLRSSRFEGVRFKAERFDAGKTPAEAVPEVTVQVALADLLLAIGRMDDARMLYGRLEALHGGSVPVRIALGQFAIRSEDFAGARRFFESALEAGAMDARLFYDYAMALRELKQPQALVEQNLLRSVQVDAGFFDAHQFLGYLYLRDERYAEAIAHLSRATEIHPNRAPVWENLALAYHKAGDKERAKNAARAGRRVASGPEEAARLDAMIDLIDSDADKIVQLPSPEERQAPVAIPSPERVQGMLTQVDCIGRRARLHIALNKGKILLLVNDASAVSIRGAGGITTDLTCGPVAPRPVIVDYMAQPQSTYGTSGSVKSIEFR
jgi:tetratricopeptide (TPR) repeat protein